MLRASTWSCSSQWLLAEMRLLPTRSLAWSSCWPQPGLLAMGSWPVLNKGEQGVLLQACRVQITQGLQLRAVIPPCCRQLLNSR